MGTDNPRATQCTKGTPTMRSLFISLALFLLALTYTEATSVTNVGATRQNTLKTGENAGYFEFWFTATSAIAKNNAAAIVVTLAAGGNSAQIWSSDAAITNVGDCTGTVQDGTADAMTFTAVTASGSQKVATFGTANNDAAAVAAGKWVRIKCIKKSGAQGIVDANGAANAVTIQVATHSDTTASTAAPAWTILAADSLSGLSSTRVSTANGAAPGALTLNFIPNKAITADQTFIFTFSVVTKVFAADDSDNSLSGCTITQTTPAASGRADAFKSATFAVSTTGTILTMTVPTAGIGILLGTTATITCPTNFAATNEDNKAVQVAVSGTGAGTAIAAATNGMYATTAGIKTWTSATRGSLVGSAAPGNLVVTFTPTTTVPVNTGKITLVASAGIFTAAKAHGATDDTHCTATTGGTATSAAPECTTSASVSGATVYDKIVCDNKGTALAGDAAVVLTCVNNMVNNPANGHTVTFTISTTQDTGTLGGQTGYTSCAASQNVVSGVCTTPSSSSAANGTSASAAAATGTETTVTQVYTFADLTVAAYTGKMKSNCECAYANTVEGASTPTWCVATTSAYTYKSGVTMSSTAAARRAAKVTFVLKVESSVKTTSQLQTLVASGSTAAAFATALTAVNTASNYTAAPGTATVATATFTGGSSSASTLLPSMLSLVAAIFVAARQ